MSWRTVWHKTTAVFEPELFLVTAIGNPQHHAIVPNVYCDSGSENLNGNVDSLVDSSEMTRTIAQIDVAFSNSLIEAFFRRLKHAWLFVHPLPNFIAVTQLTEQYIRDHNELIPHSALGGATPAEVFHGNWSQDDRDKLESQARAARNARMKENHRSGVSAMRPPSRGHRTSMTEARNPKSQRSG